MFLSEQMQLTYKKFQILRHNDVIFEGVTCYRLALETFFSDVLQKHP